MANKLYDESDIQNIANAIRSKSGKTEPMRVSQMAGEINNLSVINSGGTKIVYDEVKSNLAVSHSGNTILGRFQVEEDGVYIIGGGAQFKESTQNTRYDVYIQYLGISQSRTISYASFPYGQSYPCISWCGLCTAKAGETLQAILWSASQNFTILGSNVTIAKLP